MVGKWTLQLLGTVVLFGVGIINYYKNYDNPKVFTEPNDEDTEVPVSVTPKPTTAEATFTKNTAMYDNNGTETIISENNYDTNYKAFDEKTEELKKQIEVMIDYLENNLKSQDCSNVSKDNVTLNSEKSNFLAIHELLANSAFEYYYFYNGYNFSVKEQPAINRTEEMLKLMPIKCGLQLEEERTTFLILHYFFNEYLKNFPKNTDNYLYTECYVNSLLQFNSVNRDIFYLNLSGIDFISRMNLNKNIMKKLKQLNDCNSKLQKEDSSVTKSFALHKEDEIFKRQLTMVTKYLNSTLNSNECDKESRNRNLLNNEINFSKIILLISKTVSFIHFSHKKYTLSLLNTQHERNILIKRLTSNCVPLLEKNRSIFQLLFELFNNYYKHFPKYVHTNNRYSKCYFKSILHILVLREEYLNFLLKNNRISLQSNIEKGNKKLHDCDAVNEKELTI